MRKLFDGDSLANSLRRGSIYWLVVWHRSCGDLWEFLGLGSWVRHFAGDDWESDALMTGHDGEVLLYIRLAGTG